jgi:hypothetical protein
VRIGGALCLTPITTLAMTSVPPDRAGMASGIMSAQRAIGSTVGFAVLGSVLAAWLVATLDPDLATVIADPSRAPRHRVGDRRQRQSARARRGNRAPTNRSPNPDAATQARIRAAAESDFVQGIRLALSVAIALLALVFLGPPSSGSRAAATRC